MQVLDKVLDILKYLGITVVFPVAVIVLVMLVYPQARVIFSDLISGLGFISKWVRKTRVEIELEGAINVFIKDFNAQSSDTSLPDCEIQWVKVTDGLDRVELGKAIVRVSFHDDHDLNFYNAAYAYVRTALIPRTKPFLKRATAKAIDLLMTHTILSRTRRRSLTIFNNEYREIEPECKDRYQILAETDERGLFAKILLKELHYYGETLGEAVPKKEHEEEAEEFIEWLYNIATREPDELTPLKFEGIHIRIGVILIAKNETLREYGISRYLKWANYYASNNYGCIYLLSRGPRKARVAKEVAAELVRLGAYTNLTRKSDVTLRQRGEDVVITCIALRPDLTSILQRAWERLEQDSKEGKEISVIIQEVHTTEVIVDAYGMQASIPLSELTEMEIKDATRYYRSESELLIKVVSVDSAKQIILLSSKGTASDPKNLVDHNLSSDEGVTVQILSYRVKDGFELGIYAKVEGKPFECFIHRDKATPSKFMPLSKKYPKNSKVVARLVGFNPVFAKYIGVIAFQDPWSSVHTSCKIGDIVECYVREVAELYINCEIVEGLEGRVSVEEVSWGTVQDNLVRVKEFKPGETIRCLVKEINAAKRLIRLSIKRLSDSPAEEFYRKNKNAICDCTVSEIMEGYGAKVHVEESNVEIFVPIKEIQWGYCDSIAEALKISDQVKVVLLDFDDIHNRLRASLKRVEENEFAVFRSTFKEGDSVRGVVKARKKDRYMIVLSFDSKTVQAYVHISQLSTFHLDNLTFERMLNIGAEFSFVVRRIDPKIELVEVSRKAFLLRKMASIEPGEDRQATVVGVRHDGFHVYSDEFEGILDRTEGRPDLIGKSVAVLVARVDPAKQTIEVTLIGR